MRKTLAGTLAAAVVMAGGSAILAAPEQDRPGQMTRAEVWIQNRSRTEAVPVTVEEIATVQVTGTPTVQVSGTPTVAISPSSVAQARLVRQAWEYQTVTFPAGGDPVAALSRAGQDGWETAGLQFTTPAGTALVLKRPRP